MTNIQIGKAAPREAGEVLALYKSLVGTEGCTWNEYYPEIEDVEDDVSRGRLFVMREGDCVAAAVAMGDYDDLNDLDFWTRAKTPCEICRLGVARDKQHKGLAREMLEYAQARAREMGFDCARLLVSDVNIYAKRLYLSNGYRVMGRTNRYDIDWLCCEKELGGN